MTTSEEISVLLVDDHAILRRGVRILLNQFCNLKIVGEADDGITTRNCALMYQPDVILLDLMLPGTSITELLPEIRQVSPRSKILILSGIEDARPVYEAVDAGIDGFAIKNMDTHELVHAIEMVASGTAYLHPSISRLVLYRATQSRDNTSQLTASIEASDLPILTKRQLQVLKQIATTATNREIADNLVVSEETVRTHVKHILKKLGATTRTQAVVEAVRLGLITI